MVLTASPSSATTRAPRFSMSIATAPGILAALKAPQDTQVLHSAHYHAAIMRAIYEAEEIDPSALLRQAVAWCPPGSVFAPLAPNDGPRAPLEERFRSCGLGRLSLSGLKDDGSGTATVQGSHFATAWRRRYPVSRRPVCGGVEAMLERALSELYGGVLNVEERRCAASGADRCTFTVRRVEDARTGSAKGEGSPPRDAIAERADAEEETSLEVPGGPYAALPREFHVALAHGFEEEVPRVRGAKFASLPGILFTEAAHRNGFNLFGEILASDAWREETETSVRDDREKLELLFGVVGRLGWGRWSIQDFVARERLIVRIEASCEGQVHQELFGPSSHPRCAIARGAAAAMMNLLYLQPSSEVVPLSPSHYHALFRSPHTFRGVETRCAAMGGSYCELVVNPLTG